MACFLSNNMVDIGSVKSKIWIPGSFQGDAQWLPSAPQKIMSDMQRADFTVNYCACDKIKFFLFTQIFSPFVNPQNKLLLSVGSVRCTTLGHFHISDSVIDPVVCLRIVGALILTIYIWLHLLSLVQQTCNWLSQGASVSLTFSLFPAFLILLLRNIPHGVILGFKMRICGHI